jgi:hypothetical protein
VELFFCFLFESLLAAPSMTSPAPKLLATIFSRAAWSVGGALNGQERVQPWLIYLFALLPCGHLPSRGWVSMPLTRGCRFPRSRFSNFSWRRHHLILLLFSRRLGARSLTRLDTMSRGGFLIPPPHLRNQQPTTVPR